MICQPDSLTFDKTTLSKKYGPASGLWLNSLSLPPNPNKYLNEVHVDLPVFLSVNPTSEKLNIIPY